MFDRVSIKVSFYSGNYLSIKVCEVVGYMLQYIANAIIDLLGENLRPFHPAVTCDIAKLDT